MSQSFQIVQQANKGLLLNPFPLNNIQTIKQGDIALPAIARKG
jgi:hypothetical protein